MWKANENLSFLHLPHINHKPQQENSFSLVGSGRAMWRFSGIPVLKNEEVFFYYGKEGEDSYSEIHCTYMLEIVKLLKEVFKKFINMDLSRERIKWCDDVTNFLEDNFHKCT